MLGVTVVTLGVLLVLPAIRASEHSEINTYGHTIGEPDAPGQGAALSLFLKTTQNLSLGAVTESSARCAK